MKNRTYIAIDLKSFYDSVECRERGLDPLNTNGCLRSGSASARLTQEDSTSLRGTV